MLINADDFFFQVHEYSDILTDVRELNSTLDKIWISYHCSYAIYGLIHKVR